MIGYPLDSHVTYEADGTPVYDRGISSAPLRSLIKKLFSDGVMPNPSTNMQVVASTGMNVQVQAGFAITGGCLKLLESAETLTIEAASTLPRIDAIVLRLDDNDNVRTCELAVKKGTAASSPVAPTVRRDEVMWEICLAQIAVAANTTVITNANITDTRLDTDLCGYISSISEFDTTTLYQQIQSDLEFFREDEQARLTAWFDTFIDELTTDQAINLQNQINVLDYKIDNLDVLDTTEEIAANTDPGKITGALATKSVIDSLSALTNALYSTFDTHQYQMNSELSLAKGSSCCGEFTPTEDMLCAISVYALTKQQPVMFSLHLIDTDESNREWCIGLSQNATSINTQLSGMTMLKLTKSHTYKFKFHVTAVSTITAEDFRIFTNVPLNELNPSFYKFVA